MKARSRVLAAATAAALTATLVTAATDSATAGRGNDPVKMTRKFRQAVSPRVIGTHLDALQQIATANGDRASGNPGYAASRDYVVQRLRAAGYKPMVQAFDFPYFKENAPTELSQISPDAVTYANKTDFHVMSFSGKGDIEAEVVAVDTALTATASSSSGCEADDFKDFPKGAIALMQRGTCTFGSKAANAKAAGAAAALIFNRGTAGAEGTLNGTLGGVVGNDFPVVGLSFATGVDLGTPTGTKAHLVTDTTNETRKTFNVIAETSGGNADNVVMVGAHLDSVEGGAGINDNGSGSATILAVAEQLARQRVSNKVRFAWWGAEELGLLGSEHYVSDLKENNPFALNDIALYLNFDMVGSPNYARFVYDGNNSLNAGAVGPEGSAELETLFTDYFTGVGLASEETPFSGRSDYGPFIEVGIPAGGLFTGAEGVKTPEQAAKFGGEAGVAYDKCYHQACDDRANVNMKGLDEMSDAVAHSVYYLSQTTEPINGQGKVRGFASLGFGAEADKHPVGEGDAL